MVPTSLATPNALLQPKDGGGRVFRQGSRFLCGQIGFQLEWREYLDPFRYLNAMRSPLHNTASWVAHWSRLDGGRLAVIDPKRRLSYRALQTRVNHLAGWLLNQGIRREDRIALLLANGSPYLECLFAASQVGAIVLPINSRLSASELAPILEDSAPSLLFYTARFREVVHEACDLYPSIALTTVEVGGKPDRYETEILQTPASDSIRVMSPNDPMMLMYTSGSSGQPKGALLPHRKALFNSLNAQHYFGLRAEDRILVCTPLFHSLGLNILSLPALYVGATLVIHEGFDPEAVWGDVSREEITYLGAVPTQYQRLFDCVDTTRPLKASALRFLFTAGAPVPVELVHAYADRGLVLKQGYGQTETSTLTCLAKDDALRKAGSVGQPVFHGDVRVIPRDQIPLDPEQWQAAEPGETGEVVVRGPITMLRYWNQPDETLEVQRGEWLRTTDLGHRDEEGFLTLVGRARDMYISGGENVYPAEIEAVYETHPAIAEVAIIGIPDHRWGEVGRAHIVLRPGCPLDPDALSAWGREKLAGFKVPQQFTQETALPRTASGKVQKHRLSVAVPSVPFNR